MRILLFLFSFFFFQFANAATEQELLAQADARYKQYLAQQQAAREAYAKSQSVAKAAAAAQAVVDNGVVTSNAAMDTVVQGSSMASKSTVAKAADAAKAAGTVAARYGKAALRGAPASFLGYAAFEGLMKGVGYLIDDGSKVVMKPVVHGGSYSIHGTNNRGGSWDEAGEVFCYNWKNYFGSSSDCKFFGVSKKVSSNDNIDYYEVNVCFTNSGSCKGVTGANNTQISDGYFFKENSTTTNEKLTDQEIQQAIQKYLEENPNSNITNNIYNASYNYDNTFELSDDQTNLLARQIGQAVIDGLAAAAPTGSSTVSNNDSSGTPQKTTTTIDSTGTTTGSTSTTTTTNPDGTTTTSTTTATSDFPAFCSWATVVCDFINWMKQEPSDDPKELPTKELTSQDFSENLFANGSSCPADNTLTLPIGSQTFTYTFSYSLICPYLSMISWIFVAFGYGAGAAIVTKYS